MSGYTNRGAQAASHFAAYLDQIEDVRSPTSRAAEECEAGVRSFDEALVALGLTKAERISILTSYAVQVVIDE